MAGYVNIGPQQPGFLIEWATGQMGNTTGTTFMWIDSSTQVATTEPVSEYVMPRAGTIRNMRGRFRAAALAAANTVFVLRVNGVDTALTMTILATVQNGSSSFFNIPVQAGDRVSISTTTSAADNTVCRLQVSVFGQWAA